MTYTIAGQDYPDAEHAASAFSAAMDLDEYLDMFPKGKPDSLSWLQYQHPSLTPRDLLTLADAVHAHATRPDQPIPTRASLRPWLSGCAVAVIPGRARWEHPDDGMLTLPPGLREQPAPRTLWQRVADYFTGTTK